MTRKTEPGRRPDGFRIRSGPDADLDAYRLVGGGWALFAHLKDPRLTTDDSVTRWVVDFCERVVVVGRALKTASGSTPLPALWLGTERPSELWALEAGLELCLEVENVQNPGLFLDQRENRRRLTELVREALRAGSATDDEGVLNLFSHTGAFSMAALAGGAPRTTSVEASGRYLSWERRNLTRNFPERASSCRLLRGDARSFLRRARGRGARYRFIVIDPPTFSRGSGKPFRVRDELPGLLSDALACLPNERSAAVLVSSNDAQWPRAAFFAAVGAEAHRAGGRVEPGTVPADFGSDYPLNSAWVFRK